MTAARSVRDTHPLLAVLLAQLIYAAGVVAGIALAALLTRPFAEAAPSGPLIAVVTLLQTVAGHAPIFLLLWAWLRFYERRPFASLGLPWGRTAWRWHAAGFGLGAAFIAGWLALQYAMGNLRIEDTFAGSAAGVSALYLLPMFYLSRIGMIAIEEILYRGWLLRTGTARWGTTAGVAVSSAAFALFHFVGPLMLITPLHRFHWVLALNLVLWSVLAALLTLTSGNLWAAMAFHATPLWLTSQVFVVNDGRPQVLAMVLLSQPKASPLMGEAALAGPFTGLPTTLLLALLCAGALAVHLRRRLPVPAGPAGGR
ncbi:CPBP family intramembrane glutamic endopeptidase [Nonomuraea angiospora]|uniref:CPBP family intramembrane glutamic endopeptidase n=1 Tax=Nonomuraea angiospora TaxID=46172 RepID=UPI0029AA6187|nr:type II CAAX endopeptidase family protein [Nonomuraea angiospora]MDX3099807.1 type II CAAX endopeptidase family protein [Nonomuraea angiospora]